MHARLIATGYPISRKKHLMISTSERALLTLTFLVASVYCLSKLLRAVSTTEGETAHQTSALSREQLDAMRNQIQRETGAAVVHRGTGTAHPIGTGGVDFGKGGIPIDGAGFGGAARIAWNGSAHTIEKTGGVLFSVAVNGRKVTDTRTLEPGDVIELGKSHFTYQVQ